MPIISTNKPELHKRLKRYVVENDSTLGRTIDKFTEFGMEFRVDSLSKEELEELRQLASSKGMTIRDFLKLLRK